MSELCECRTRKGELLYNQLISWLTNEHKLNTKLSFNELNNELKKAFTQGANGRTNKDKNEKKKSSPKKKEKIKKETPTSTPIIKM